MDWMTGEVRDLFAKAFVNRVWSNYFHRGIVEPTDDLSLANPPTNQALLDHLAQGFIAQGYDMKWLHREICNSRTYQLSWQPTESNRLDERNFSRAVPRRIQAEVAYDALVQATAGMSQNAGYLTNLKQRATAIPGSAQGRGGNNYALTIFGKSARENNCDCERSNEPTLLQTLFLYNDNDVLTALDSRGGWLAEVAREWNQPLLSNPNEPTIRKPENYDEIVARYRSQIERAKNQSNPERLQQMKARLKAFLEQYGETDKAEARGKATASGVSEEARRIAVREAYLRTLSRLPSAEEEQTALQAMSATETPVEGLRDVLWALLNTKEFILNH